MRKSHAQMMKSIHFVFLFTSLLTTTHAGRDHSSPQVISSKKLKKHKDSGSMITKDIYMNSWAVRVVGDNLMAQKVAVENGFMYKGKVYGDVYEFIHRGVPRRRKRASFIKTLRLGKDNRVRWTQQQASKRRVKRSIHFNDEKWPDQWYLHRTEPGYEGHDMNILPVWKRGITGKGVVVSILDDGIEHTHPELRDNYDKKASFDYNNNDTDPMPNYTWREDNTHGTRCAGEVAAKPNNTRCLVGVAYGARIGGIRMLDGEITDMIEAQSLRHNRDYIDIYSSSWGPEDDGRTVEGPGLLTEQTLAAGAKLGRKGRGSIFVWASGNGGKQMDYCNCDGYTNSIYTISVSAATAHGKQPWYLEHCASTLVSTYSSGKSRHDKHIVTADLKGGCTDSHTGTSVSPPMVAGVAALALEVNPKLTWRDVQHLLVETSSLKNLEDSDFQYNGVKKRFSHSYGFGLINADKMVTMAEKWPTIGEQHVCVKEKEVLYPQNRFNKSQPLVLHLNTTACHGTKQYIKYIEHVQLVASLFHYKRGATEISIQSPMGTISWVLRRRDRDDMPGNFNQWKFLSTHFWGEDPRGMWKVSFYSTGSSSGQGQGFAQEMKLRIYGTEEKPGEDTSKKIDSSLCHAECSSYCTGTENHECDSCKNLHYLDDSGTKHCVATCPAKMYLDNEKKQCLSCHNTCLKCSGRNETDCVTCYPDDVMLNGRCVKECPKGMFKTQDTHNKELHHCQFCFKRCTSCSGTSSNCSSCHKGSTLHGNQCAAACASDQWLDGNKCKLCHNSCKTCIGGMEFNCTSCSKKIFNDKYDRFLYKATSQCLATCPLGTYQSETLLKECLDCQDNCLRCSNNGQKCEICRMDHFLVADLRTCVETCPEGYYTDLLKRTCEPCDIQCKTCVVGNPSACTSCRESFFLKEQSCVSSHECRSLYYVNKKTGRCNFCPSNCTHCESQKSCTQCLLSYFLTPDNRCVSECPKGTFPVASQRCHRCHPSCTHCNGPSQYDCTLCPDDHSLLNGECLETQPSGHYVALYGGVSSYQQCHHYCAECDGPTYGNCTKCIGKLDMRDKKCVNPCPGQWLSDNSCETCHPTCLSCSGPSSRNCLQCNSGYLLNIVTRQCTKNCHRKYYKDMKTQTCRPCHHSCGTCFGANPDQCITCPPKLRFFNNTCLNECPIGWYSQLAVSRVCRRCSPQCNSCQYNPTLCTGCGSNRVWHDFKCFDSCEKGMFQDSNNKRCYRCHESCLTCNGTAPNECLICAEGMTLDKGICVEGCLIGQYNSSLDGGNCKACPKDCIQCHEHGDTKEPKCTICSRTTSLQLDGSCSPQCSPGTYRLPYDNICKSCSINNCLECPLGKKCTKCKTLYKPTTSGHQCESACEEGTYQDLTEQKCADCHHLCLTCNGPTKHGCPICRKKALTLIKRDKQTSCVLECPVGYYQQERHCLPCDGKCKTCETESEQCLSCNEPYILERTNCIAECSEAYYRDLKANQCIPCSTNCSECSPDGCSKCKPASHTI
uniref:P/Homo B domain-containing protein n=1 Tax=Clytia hemisphaerica TaxID=252671 RepID=A0A7M5X1B5_9CNID